VRSGHYLGSRSSRIWTTLPNPFLSSFILLATQKNRFNSKVVKANSKFETFKSTADENNTFEAFDGVNVDDLNVDND
jgi:hypothetical protein